MKTYKEMEVWLHELLRSKFAQAVMPGSNLVRDTDYPVTIFVDFLQSLLKNFGVVIQIIHYSLTWKGRGRKWPIIDKGHAVA
jgi:hypothetical protein